MKKIGIVEYQPNHYDFVISVYLIIKALYPKSTIILFLTQKLYDSLIIELHDRNIEIDTKNIVILKSKFNDFSKYKLDATIFNTLTISKSLILHFWYIMLNKGKIFIGIHNINQWLFFGPKKIGNILYFILKKLVLKKISGVIVLNSELKKYFVSKSNIPVIDIPFKIASERYIEKDNNDISFIIPGMVDSTRRNYIQLLESFSSLMKVYPNIKLVLLGKMKEEKIENLIYDLNIQDKTTYFKEFISQSKFNSEMLMADFIVSPINKYHYTIRGKELYGVTKASGAEFDAIKYKKPLIINNTYIVDSKLKTSTIYFKNENDLETVIKKTIDDKNAINKYKKNAIENAQAFSIESFIHIQGKELSAFFNIN